MAEGQHEEKLTDVKGGRPLDIETNWGALTEAQRAKHRAEAGRAAVEILHGEKIKSGGKGRKL